MSQRIDDGFSTTITFANNGSVRLYEKTVTPPGYDGGGPNDITTMRNTKYRTFSPKKLITVSRMQSTVSYQTGVYTDILAMLNVNQQITVTFPDATAVQFWGWIDKFTPGEIREGEQPTATIEIEPSNHDNTTPNPAEVAPTIPS